MVRCVIMSIFNYYKYNKHRMIYQDFLIRMTGFEPATSWSQRHSKMQNKQICSKIKRIFRKFYRFRPMCPSVTTQKNSVNGQTCGQPDFAKKRKKIQLHPYFSSLYSNSQVKLLVFVIFSKTIDL